MTADDTSVRGRGVVVVLSWFGAEDTVRCVESLRVGEDDAEILVIDNGSYDGVIDEVRLRFPGVHLLQTGENLGFAGGMNAGLRWSLQRGAAFVTVLNNDTVVPPGAIALLQEDASADVAVSPEVRYLDHPERIWFGGGALDRRQMLPHHVPATELPPDTDRVRTTQILAGCSITASAATWERVGLFDERFFLNFEDSEWSLRARAAGVTLMVDPRVSILHKVSASFTRTRGILGAYYYTRGGMLFGRLAGGSLLARSRFLKNRVARPVVRAFRDDGVRKGIRFATIVGVALIHYRLGRFGRIPRRWEERVDSW